MTLEVAAFPCSPLLFRPLALSYCSKGSEGPMTIAFLALGVRDAAKLICTAN